MSITVTGVKEIERGLKLLSVKVNNKLNKAAMSAGLRVIVKAIKSEVPSTWKEGRKAIGFSVKKTADGLLVGKAGVAVGFKAKRRQKNIESSQAKRAGKKRRGVGMSVANFHWFVTGTAERKTGTKTGTAKVNGTRVKTLKATGNAVRRTGRIKKNPIVQRGFNKSRGSAVSAMQKNIASGIEREAAKGK